MKERNDFARLRHAILRQGKLDRAPLIELHVDLPVKEAFIGRKIQTAADEAEFWVTAGYDYAPIATGLLQVGGVMSGEATQTSEGRYSLYEDRTEINWAAEGQGIIQTVEDVAAFPWPDAETLDLSPITELADALPAEMPVIVIIGKLFTPAWMLLGFEGFAEASLFNRPLLDAIFERITAFQFRVFERAIELPKVAGIWHSDDLAFGTGLLVSPEVYRHYVFPWYRRMGEICRARDLLYIYHSDGNLHEVFDDLIACGFHALHPIEPQAMDARQVKAQVGDHLCLLGNIDVDLLARGTPDQVRKAVRANLRDLTADGGYCPGSANSVTHYCRLDNYRALIETAFEG